MICRLPDPRALLGTLFAAATLAPTAALGQVQILAHDRFVAMTHSGFSRCDPVGGFGCTVAHTDTNDSWTENATGLLDPFSAAIDASGWTVASHVSTVSPSSLTVDGAAQAVGVDNSGQIFGTSFLILVSTSATSKYEVTFQVDAPTAYVLDAQIEGDHFLGSADIKLVGASGIVASTTCPDLPGPCAGTPETFSGTLPPGPYTFEVDIVSVGRASFLSSSDLTYTAVLQFASAVPAQGVSALLIQALLLCGAGAAALAARRARRAAHVSPIPGIALPVGRV